MTFHFSGGRSYQLSYLAIASKAATPTGLEPATSAVTGRRANQLRYGASCEGRCPFGQLEKHNASDPLSRNRARIWRLDKKEPLVRRKSDEGPCFASPTGFEPVLPP